jgi:hypothetical protein
MHSGFLLSLCITQFAVNVIQSTTSLLWGNTVSLYLLNPIIKCVECVTIISMYLLFIRRLRTASITIMCCLNSPHNLTEIHNDNDSVFSLCTTSPSVATVVYLIQTYTKHQSQAPNDSQVNSTSNEQLLEVPPSRLQTSTTHPLTVDGLYHNH